MDLFLTLGTVFFAIEILHRAYDFYMIISLRMLIKEHQDCEECAEEELLNELRNKERNEL